ncbi:MAG TPA: hypothetical protein VFV10_11220 [Gammaproteobacteria bacterium]|nr:hypothetical protein [Gammaproteobacteria bacterium]
MSRSRSRSWFAVPLAAGVLMSACAAPGLFGRSAAERTADQAAFGAGKEFAAQSLSVYLELMRGLVEGDPVSQAETLRSVERTAEESPTTTNRLKLALALGTPGHAGSDPERAARLLNDLLASGAALLPEERALVAVHLKEIEQRLVLNAEAEQLRKESKDALAAQSTESQRRIDAATAENAKLRKQLEEAEQKLNAITNIERSIRERENGANTK